MPSCPDAWSLYATSQCFLKYLGYIWCLIVDCPSKYNLTVELNDISIVVQLPQNVLFIIVFMFVTCTPVMGFGQK